MEVADSTADFHVANVALCPELHPRDPQLVRGWWRLIEAAMRRTLEKGGGEIAPVRSRTAPQCVGGAAEAAAHCVR